MVKSSDSEVHIICPDDDGDVDDQSANINKTNMRTLTMAPEHVPPAAKVDWHLFCQSFTIILDAHRRGRFGSVYIIF